MKHFVKGFTGMELYNVILFVHSIRFVYLFANRQQFSEARFAFSESMLGVPD